jgi:hypothetical protein
MRELYPRHRSTCTLARIGLHLTWKSGQRSSRQGAGTGSHGSSVVLELVLVLWLALCVLEEKDR